MRRVPCCTLMLFLFAAVAPRLALAEGPGVLVRFEAGDRVLDAPVTAVLKDGSTVHELELYDDGSGADVTAGDGVWAGSGFVDGEEFEVSLQTATRTYSGGAASWSSLVTARDIDLRFEGDTLVVKSGDGGGVSGASADEGAVASAVGNAATSGDLGATAYLWFLAGLLAGLGVVGALGAFGWVSLRKRSRPKEAPAPPVRVRVRGVELVPEAGIFGGISPSLSDGLCVWKVSEEDLQTAIYDALSTLARYHQVLVMAPSGLQMPSVPGGPVYVSTTRHPKTVSDLMEQLARRRGRPAALLLVGQGSDAERYRDLADALPANHGGLALVHKSVAGELPTMAGERIEGRWKIQVGADSMVLCIGPHGLGPAVED